MHWPKILNPKASNDKIGGPVRTKQAFQRMWVAGSLGAFFIAIARTLPGDIDRLRNLPPGVRLSDLAAVTALRYLYLLWLLWYFFLSNLRGQPDERPNVNDISFDVVQSFCALTAAFFLDFIIPTHHAPREAFAAVSIAIAVISALSLFWFGCNNEPEKPNLARGLGFGAALLSLVESLWIPRNWRDYVFAGTMLVPLSLLYIALAKFHRNRVKKVEPPEKSTTQPCGAAPSI